MKRTHSIAAIALTGLVGVSALSAPIAASASENGKKNTAIALGAAALGLLLTQHNKLPGIVAAGGAAYAYSQYNKDVQNRHRDERYGYNYDRGYRNNNNGYRYSDNTNPGNYRRDDSGYPYSDNNQDGSYQNDQNDNGYYRDNGNGNNRNDRWSSQNNSRSRYHRTNRSDR